MRSGFPHRLLTSPFFFHDLHINCPNMPAEHPLAVVHDQQQDQPAQQIKFCSLCHSTLADNPSIFLPDADVLVCQTCREHILRTPRPSQQLPTLQPVVVAQQDQRPSRLDSYHINRPPPVHDVASRRPPLSEISPSSQISDSTTTSQALAFPGSSAQHDGGLSYPHAVAGPSSSQQSPQQHHQLPTHSQTSSSRIPVNTSTGSLKIATSHAAVSTPPSISALSTCVAQRPQQHHSRSQPHLDPLADITRLRVRSQGYHCLYPGATFDGTQKSGRNSYEVNVTIVVRRTYVSHRALANDLAFPALPVYLSGR